MKLHLYDFDDTIYKGNTVFHFFMFCYRRKLFKFNHILRVLFKGIQYKSKHISNQEMHSFTFSYLKNVSDIAALVNEFWESHRKNLKQFYLDKKDKSKDIIISASMDFLIRPICEELKVKDLIASDVNKKTGKFNKPACKRGEKVTEFRKLYPKAKIVEMYSDSLSDAPLLELADKSYIVRGDKIYDYKSYKPSLFIRFWNWGWGIYNKNPEIWNYLIVGALTTIVSIGTYALFSKTLDIHYIISNVLSWICAVIFAYFANRWFVFHSNNTDKLKEAVSFIGSRVITLLLDTALMILLVDFFSFDDLASKIFVQIIVVIVNYIISKFFVFKEGTNEKAS